MERSVDAGHLVGDGEAECDGRGRAGGEGFDLEVHGLGGDGPELGRLGLEGRWMARGPTFSLD